MSYKDYDLNLPKNTDPMGQENRSTFVTGCRWTCQVVGCQVPCLNSRFRREAAAKNEAEGMRETLTRTPTLWETWQLKILCLIWNTLNTSSKVFIFQPVTVSLPESISPVLGVWFYFCRESATSHLFLGWRKNVDRWPIQWYKKETKWITCKVGPNIYHL